MKELELQKYLRKGLSPESLTENYSITVNRSKDFPELYGFKYNLLSSPFSEKIVKESRGIVLNSLANWNIVAYPYEKFFNYGQIGSDLVNFNKSQVYEKLDGKLIIMYYYRGDWRVATTGRCDASSTVGKGSKLTFSELLWDTWNQLGYDYPNNINYTYMFELMTSLNRVIVDHKSSSIVLHGIRNNITGLELKPEIVKNTQNWKICSNYPFNSIKDVLSEVNNLDPSTQEGFIVVDDSFKRVKIKNKEYVSLSLFRNKITLNNFLKIIIKGETPEFLTYFPEYKEIFTEISLRYEAVVDEFERIIAELRENYNETDYRGMGLFLNRNNYSSFLIGCIKYGKSVKTMLKDSSFRTVKKLINIEDLEC